MTKGAPQSELSELSDSEVLKYLKFPMTTVMTSETSASLRCPKCLKCFLKQLCDNFRFGNLNCLKFAGQSETSDTSENQRVQTPKRSPPNICRIVELGRIVTTKNESKAFEWIIDYVKNSDWNHGTKFHESTDAQG